MIQPINFPTLSTEITFTEEEQLIIGYSCFCNIMEIVNMNFKTK